MDDCIFCKIAKGEIPAEKLFENDEFVAFRDIRPAAPTHILLIPRAHIPTLNDAASHAELLGRMLAAAREIAGKAGIADSGYRTVINCNRNAGQEVFHLHLHILGGRQLGAMG